MATDFSVKTGGSEGMEQNMSKKQSIHSEVHAASKASWPKEGKRQHSASSPEPGSESRQAHSLAASYNVEHTLTIWQSNPLGVCHKEVKRTFSQNQDTHMKAALLAIVKN